MEPAMELEHAIGFASGADHPLHVHPDGSSIVYALGGCVVISQLKDVHNQTFLREHDDLVTCLDVSSSGRLIASGQKGDNADVFVWEYQSAGDGQNVQTRIVHQLQEHDGGVLFVQFSADERFLLTVGMDKKMYVWDMHTGCYVAKTSPLKQAPNCACWGGRARNIKGRETQQYQLATGAEAQLTYWTFDPQAGTLTPEECTLGNQVRNFTAVCFSPDAAYLYAGSSSSDFTAVHVKHKVMHSTTVVGSKGVNVIMCQGYAEGDRVIVGCGDGLVTVLDGARNGAQTCRVYSKGPDENCSAVLDGGVCALQLNAYDEASGRMRLLAGTTVGSLCAVELSAPDHMAAVAARADVRTLQSSHFAKVVAVSYPSDSSDHFATASEDGTLRVWDVNTYEIYAVGACQTQITGPPLCLNFTGEVLFSGWKDGRIRAHAGETGTELWSMDNAHKDGCTALVASHNRKFLVSGGEQGEVRVWEIRTREMVVNLKQHTSPVTSLQLTMDDASVYSSSRDRTILFWNLRAEAREFSMAQRMGGINCIAMLDGSTNLVSVGQEKMVSVWDRRESAPLAATNGPPGQQMGEQMCIALHASENPNVPPEAEALFATAGAGDCCIRLWKFGHDLSPQLLAICKGHSSTVLSLQFSPDGKQLVSVGEDCAVLVWNIFREEIFEQ